MSFTWFPFSLLATLCFGVGMALYKLPAARNHNRFVATLWSLVVPAALSLLFFSSYLPLTTPGMLVAALVWGSTFTGLVLLQMYALNHVDTNVLFPLTTTASLIITVLVGVFWFQEPVSVLQTVGVILAVFTIFLFVYKGGVPQYSRLVVAVGGGIVLISAFNKILQKVVAGEFDIHAFQVYQYSFGALVALGVYLALHRHDWRRHIFSGGLGIGSAIGVFSFFGGYALYSALVRGPFPLITSIHSLYILITALTAFILFREQLTAKKIVLLLLAIISVILIRVG